MFFFCFKQKTAYEMRISDWSSDVCSSDLRIGECVARHAIHSSSANVVSPPSRCPITTIGLSSQVTVHIPSSAWKMITARVSAAVRSEEHTSELQSLMRISYAVFCLKQKNNTKTRTTQS